MIFQDLIKPFFVLAPMDDVTDVSFRQMIASLASPDLFFTEFVNVDGLMSEGRDRLMVKLKHSKQDKPIIAQLWGSKPDNFKEIALQIKDMGFDGIDLNMGCPDKTIVKNGCCSALINDRDLAADIIAKTIEGSNGLPVSVKTRVGFNQVDLTWFDFLMQFNLSGITVNGRTKKEMSKVPANWDLIAQVVEMRNKKRPDLLIIGNGDVDSRADGLNKAKTYGVDGIMIGRGVLKDPFVFATDSPWINYSPADKIKLFIRHIELFKQNWPNGERKIVQLFKFAKLYINNFDGASELRSELMNIKSIEQALTILNSSLTSFNDLKQG